jgi:hypothetical protein
MARKRETFRGARRNAVLRPEGEDERGTVWVGAKAQGRRLYRTRLSRGQEEKAAEAARTARRR